MIYTITLNPSVDYVMELESFQEGELNRAKQTNYFPGGKGINVSRVLKRLGANTAALGFVAGFTGNFIQQKLMEEQVNTLLLEVSGESRINVKLKAGDETEINGTGPIVDESAISSLLNQLDSLTTDDFVVLAGSIPSTINPRIYEILIQKCQTKGAKVVLDTGGTVLKELLFYKPFFIKPNHLELAELFGVAIQSIDEVVYYAKKLHDQGIENVVVSMAGDGAVLYTGEGVYLAKAPKGEVKNSVGAGDSLVAGFLAEYVKSGGASEALKFGIASGSATAFSHDLCRSDEVLTTLNEVTIEKWTGKEE
ncbi:1-phosphofructokinase [Sutcliffiella rhizosphaerae]|uniref:Tagatose-6-phosphate kinase n=1 Tax=Sutcliffiella rhizosphaerae TaxID=2880967 RepID=A0ABM8YPA9_9BACI|nr:1-phosphofructokinase [Sutcliffiella rhizosphaerae]CAG9621754.1 Tagatose-6-phosphate kinase [Sutcliffiella rhizosphaerae]